MLKELFSNKERTIEYKFYDLMYELGIHNKSRKTYRLEIAEKTNEGYKVKLHLPIGLNFNSIEDHVDDIQRHLQCKWDMEYGEYSNYADVNIVLV